MLGFSCTTALAERETTADLLTKAMAEQAENDRQVNPAEQLRQFFSKHHAVDMSRWWKFSGDLAELYSVASIEKPPGCPLTNFLDQPAVARLNAVNVFAVEFTSPHSSVCPAAPDASACMAVADSCITFETSVFCDYRYLERRAAIAGLAYLNAWRGLSGALVGEKVTFLPLPRAALEELAEMAIAARQGGWEPPGLRQVNEGRWMAKNAPSSVHDLAHSVALLIPVLHEIAHIEQSYCQRGIAKQGSDDFVARLLLSGKRDDKASADIYELLTCSRLALNEFDADLRSIDMLLRYLEKEAPKAAATGKIEFSDEVPVDQRSALRSLSRWSREVALISIAYAGEYDLLIHNHPELGLEFAQNEPSQFGQYSSYYINAAQDPQIRPVRGHIELAYRTTQLARKLDMRRLQYVNNGNARSLIHNRIAPFSIGRFMSMRSDLCDVVETEETGAVLVDYVLEAYQELPGKRATSATGPGSLEAARELLGGFLEPGANRYVLSQRLRPTLQDYRSIFHQPFSDRIFEAYEEAWNRGEMVIEFDAEQTELHVFAASSDELREYGGSNGLPAGYRHVSDKIRPGLTIYSWRFVRPGAKFGMAYNGLYFVNGHWVIIPKPYRIE